MQAINRPATQRVQSDVKVSQLDTYIVYAGMIARCEDPKNTWYPRYGGAGIKVCARWRKSFANFYKDMGKRPAKNWIALKRNARNYNKSNCFWIAPGKLNKMRAAAKKSRRHAEPNIYALPRAKKRILRERLTP